MSGFGSGAIGACTGGARYGSESNKLIERNLYSYHGLFILPGGGTMVVGAETVGGGSGTGALCSMGSSLAASSGCLDPRAV